MLEKVRKSCKNLYLLMSIYKNYLVKRPLCESRLIVSDLKYFLKDYEEKLARTCYKKHEWEVDNLQVLII